MNVTCNTCGDSWTGLRIEHCPSCHFTFTGSSSGDMHRTGDHAVTEGPDRRRCLTSEEMRAKGMARNDRGQWTTGKSDAAWWKDID
jgi:hypothetical protein